jgi:hexosaminidase
VGFSALCPDREGTYRLIDDVVRELAALTPGPYFHIGGDEVETLNRGQYTAFIERVHGIVRSHGKRMIGWEEIQQATLDSTVLVQQWKSDSARNALRWGGRLILSHAPRLYLDMKHTAATELGLRWAGLVEVQTAYDWDPARLIAGVGEGSIVGIEAPLWTETVRNITAAQYLAMPRLPAYAEVAWTPQNRRDWGDFRLRIAAHAPRWRLLGINFYPSPQIPW